MRKILFCALLLLSGVATIAQPIDDFNMSFIGKLPVPIGVEVNDVWGYADETGKEYAIVGRENSTYIADVSDPTNPTKIFEVPGLTTPWRDIKVWEDYAYITCECYNGLLIIDMSPLPGSTNLPYTYWMGDTAAFLSAHNLYIDEKGFAYIFGANYQAGGAIILDLTNDPMDPEFVGAYDDHYLHDGVVRNDTLWGAAIYVGEAQMIDVTNRASPQLVSSWKTPNAFTHNMWFSDDGNYLFTTDEVRNGSIGSYDISNPLNPTRLDIWTPNDTGLIPHNVHYINEFLVTSHYTIGVSIMDVRRPNNMLEVGRYDTSPDFHYDGFSGCWGAYPWLPSGNILASDREEGLYVLSADYKRGCYLEGAVTDQHDGSVIFYPSITIIEEDLQTEGSIIGEYAMATLSAGTYSVKVEAEGYYSKTIEGVQLQNGELTELDVQLSNWPTGLEESFTPNKLKVFPNPAVGEMNIESATPIDEIEIMDVNGMIVQRITVGESRRFTASTDQLATGTYFIKVSTREGVQYRPLSIL